MGKAVEILGIMGNIMARFREGGISAIQAENEIKLCQGILKGIETADLEKRLERLEETLKL